MAEEPQPPGAGWAGKVPGTGTSSLSTGLWGGARPPLGSSGTAPSPTCLHATVRKKSRVASGRARLSPCPPARLRGAGWPLTSSPSGLLGHAGAPARTCKHPRARSRALQPQPEPLIPPLIGRIAPSQPAQVCLLLVSGQICARRFLVPQLRDASNSSAAAFQINPTPPASTNSELPARSGAGRGRTPTRSRLGQAGPGAEKPRQPQPTSARPHAAPRASGSHRGVR